MKKIDLMHYMYGKEDGICKSCSHLVENYNRSNKYYKCEVYGETHSDATDWRLKYPACGLFNKETDHRNVYKLAKKEKQEIAEGQVSLF